MNTNGAPRGNPMDKALTYFLGAALVAAALYFYFAASPAVPAPPVAPPSAASRPVDGPPGGNHGESSARRVATQVQTERLEADPGSRPDAVEGVVRDRDGNPLDDADVEFVQFSFDRKRVRVVEGASRNVVARTVSGKDGRYLLTLPEGFPLGSPGSLFAEKRGFVGQHKDLIKPGSRVDFTLNRGVPVAGRALDEATGAPVVGALVRGWYATEGEKRADRAYRWQEDVRTDPKGEFRFEGAPEGVVKFLVFHDDYYDYFEDRTLTYGPENRVDLRVRRGIAIEGVALDAVSRKPVADADVAVLTGVLLPRRFAKTDAQGRFRATGLEEGPVQVSFTAKGYGEQRLPRTIGAADDYRADRDNRVVFELLPAASMAGRVVDFEGRPVAGAKILVAELRQVFWVVRDREEATTDAGGGFLVDDLRAGGTYRAVAVTTDGEERIGVGDDVKTDAGRIHDGVEVRIPRGGGVVGRATDEGGAPVAGVDVTLARPPFLGVTFPPGIPYGQRSVLAVKTDAEGRYEFKGLWAGDQALTFDHPEFVLVDRDVVKLNVDEEIATHDVKLVRGGDISGTVSHADGARAAGVEVRAYAPFSTTAIGAATTLADGSYRLLRLRPGEYAVRAASADRKAGAPVRERVPAGTSGVDLVLAAFPHVGGSVVDQAGRAVPKFTLTLTPVDRRDVAPGVKPAAGAATLFATRSVAVEDEGGLFRIESVEPGRYVVDLKAGGYAATRTAEVDVTPGTDQDLGALVVRAGGAAEGVVTDERGVPVPEADVLLARIGGGPIPSLEPVKNATGGPLDASYGARTDATGRYRIGAVAQGQYLLRVDSPRHVPSAPKQVNVLDGEASPMDVRLSRAGAVAVEVRDAAGEPVAHCLIEARDADDRLIPPGQGAERVARTNKEGKCRLPRLPLGPVKLRARSAGATQDLVVTVVDGEERAATFVVQSIPR